MLTMSATWRCLTNALKRNVVQNPSVPPRSTEKPSVSNTPMRINLSKFLAQNVMVVDALE